MSAHRLQRPEWDRRTSQRGVRVRARRLSGPHTLGTVTPMTSPVAAARSSLDDLLHTFGASWSDVGRAAGAPVVALRGLGDGAPLDEGPARRLVDLHALLRAAAPAGQEPAVTTALTARIVEQLAPTLLDVFVDGRDDLVAAALAGDLSGTDLLDAWRPTWRETLDVSWFAVVAAADGHPALVLRDPADVATDRTRHGLASGR